MRLLPAVSLGLAFAACGGATAAPLHVEVPWQHPALEDAATKLRRAHRVGDVYEQCEVVRVHVGVGKEPPAHLSFDVGAVFEVTSAPEGGPFVLAVRGGRGSVDARAGEQRDSDERVWDALVGSHEVTATNHILASGRKEPPPPTRDPQHFDFAMVPNLRSLLDDEWPEAPLRAGATWTRDAERTTYASDGTPTHHLRRARWTFLGVESAGEERFAHLRCEGSWSSQSEVDGEGGSGATGTARGRFACAGRLSLRDGHTARWRIVLDGGGEIRVRDGAGKESRSGYTVAGAEDAAVDPVPADRSVPACDAVRAR